MEKSKISLAVGLMAAATLPLCAQRVETLPFGDFEHWTVRHIKESAILGGQTRTLYVLGPDEVIEGNRAYDYSRTPWASSNAYAKVSGITKTSVSVEPDDGPDGRCARLSTVLASCKVAGLVEIQVLATGALYWGKMLEPITGVKDPYAKMDWGIPFTKHPEALLLDYKAALPGLGKLLTGTTFRKKEIPGDDPCQVTLLLQRRWEDADGGIHAERVGTAFRINGQQVTRQVIPWDEFLKTQPGVRIEQVEIAPSAPAESAAPETAAAETAEPADDDSDISDDFDDLFDDNPKPKKKKAPARAAAKKPAPQPSAPTVATKVVFDGTFRPNTKTKAMVDRLNKIRTDMEVLLRKGGTCFFGPRYSTVTADRAPTDMFLSAVPQAMRENSDYEDFASAVRAKGIVFLPESVLRDLFRNRLDYVKLQERARAVKEERAWEKKLNNSIR